MSSFTPSDHSLPPLPPKAVDPSHRPRKQPPYRHKQNHPYQSFGHHGVAHEIPPKPFRSRPYPSAPDQGFHYPKRFKTNSGQPHGSYEQFKPPRKPHKFESNSFPPYHAFQTVPPDPYASPHYSSSNSWTSMGPPRHYAPYGSHHSSTNSPEVPLRGSSPANGGSRQELPLECPMYPPGEFAPPPIQKPFMEKLNKPGKRGRNPGIVPPKTRWLVDPQDLEFEEPAWTAPVRTARPLPSFMNEREGAEELPTWGSLPEEMAVSKYILDKKAEDVSGSIRDTEYWPALWSDPIFCDISRDSKLPLREVIKRQRDIWAAHCLEQINCEPEQYEEPGFETLESYSEVKKSEEPPENYGEAPDYQSREASVNFQGTPRAAESSEPYGERTPSPGVYDNISEPHSDEFARRSPGNEHPPEEIIPDELPPEEPVYQPSYSFRGRGRGRGRGWGYDGHFQSDYAGRHMTRPYEGRGRGRGRGLRGGRYQGYNHRGPRSRPPLRSHPYVAEPLRYSTEDGIYQPTGDMHYDPRVFDYKYQYDGYAERYPQGYENKYAYYREGHGSFRGRPPQHYNAYSRRW